MDLPIHRILVFGVPAASGVDQLAARLPGLDTSCVSLVEDPDRPGQQIARIDMPFDPRRADRVVGHLGRIRLDGHELSPWLLTLHHPSPGAPTAG